MKLSPPVINIIFIVKHSTVHVMYKVEQYLAFAETNHCISRLSMGNFYYNTIQEIV